MSVIPSLRMPWTPLAKKLMKEGLKTDKPQVCSGPY